MGLLLVRCSEGISRTESSTEEPKPSVRISAPNSLAEAAPPYSLAAGHGDVEGQDLVGVSREGGRRELSSAKLAAVLNLSNCSLKLLEHCRFPLIDHILSVMGRLFEQLFLGVFQLHPDTVRGHHRSQFGNKYHAHSE